MPRLAGRPRWHKQTSPTNIPTAGGGCYAIVLSRIQSFCKNHAKRGFFTSSASAFSSLPILSAMLASKAAAIFASACANSCAANLATLAGFMMYAFDEPGGFVRQVWFMPSGGQDTTGNLDEYDAVPDKASVPPHV